MDIKEIDNFNLSDAVKFHDSLNPNLWINEKLDSKVRKQLLLIAKDFISSLGIGTLNVKDITLSGSNAAYSWTDHSDIDLHIVVDIEKLTKDDVYRELFDAKKNIYNDSHDITIHDIPVELYVQDSNQPHVSLGEYSVLNDAWIKIPTKKKANLDQWATKEKYETLAKLIKLALKSKDEEKVNKLIKTIKRYRQAGLALGGEFSPENLAYKLVKHDNLIDQLFKLRDQLHSNALSIEENVVELDEVSMNPKAYSKSLTSAATKEILVGFEFEFCVNASLLMQKMRETKPTKKQFFDAGYIMLADLIGYHQAWLVNKNEEDVFYFDPSKLDKLISFIHPINGINNFVELATKAIEMEIYTYEEAFRQILDIKEEPYLIFCSDPCKYFTFNNINAALKLLNMRLELRREENGSFVFASWDDFSVEDIDNKINNEFSLAVVQGPEGDYTDNYAFFAEKMASSIQKEMGLAEPVIVFYEYHQENKNTNNWYLEPDGSISPDESSDVGMELVSPPLPYNQALKFLDRFYARYKQMLIYTEESASTSLHVNISIPKNIDMLKLVMFLGDEYVLQTFDREDIEYATSLFNRLKKAAGNIIYNTPQQFIKSLMNKVTAYADEHYSSINYVAGKNYFSFRHIGGDYIHNESQVIETLSRFLHAMIIASDPNLYRKEYLTKLYKLFPQEKKPNTNVQLLKEALKLLKDFGIPSVHIVTSSSSTNNDMNIVRRMLHNYSLEEALSFSHNYIQTKPTSQDYYEYQYEYRTKPRTLKTRIYFPIFTNIDQAINVIRTMLHSYNENIVRCDLVTSTKGIAKRGFIRPTDPSWKILYKKVSDALIQNVKRNNMNLSESKKNNMLKLSEDNEMPVYYFAYGMLTDPMFIPDGKILGIGELRNFEYNLYTFANVEPKPGKKVYGTLWQINRRILKKLDSIEGYPTLYDRKTYPVYHDGKKYVAEVYVMTMHTLKRSQGTVPGQNYVNTVTTGYNHIGIPTQQIKDALAKAYKNAKPQYEPTVNVHSGASRTISRNDNVILDLIEKAKEMFGENRLYNGNCGMFAVAIAQILKEQNINVKLGLLFDDSLELNNPIEIMNTESLLYHVVISYKDKLYDGSGMITNDDLINLAAIEYNDYHPGWFTQVNPFDKDVLQLIRNETKWNISYSQFYHSLNGLDFLSEDMKRISPKNLIIK